MAATATAARAHVFQLSCRARARANGGPWAPPPPLPPATTATTVVPHRRTAATSSNPGGGSARPGRRSITVTSDDGRYGWSELSTGEKAARSTQQTINFLLVVAGLAGTGLVSYFLYAELLAADSKTVLFNRAVDRVKASAACRELLGPSRQIVAYGESTPGGSKWARSRPLAYSTEVSRATGTQHVRMHFNVEGPKGSGVVSVHMTRPPGAGAELEYSLLSLTVPGHETVYLENRDAARGFKGKASKMFGIQWR